MNEVYWKKKGGYFVSPNLYKEWVVKIPTSRHRLNRTGTVGLDLPQQYDLEKKKGILLIDGSVKGYFFIPRDIVQAHFLRQADYSGVKNAIWIYDVKAIIQKDLVPKNPIHSVSGVSDGAIRGSSASTDIRKKFGI